MFYILTSEEHIVQVTVRQQEIRNGDSAVSATLALSLKSKLSPSVFLEQQGYISFAANAAYISLNKIDQKKCFKSSINLNSESLEALNFVKGSSSSGLGYALSLFEAFWKVSLNKESPISVPVFTSGEINNRGQLKAIEYLDNKLKGVLNFVKTSKIHTYIICLPYNNVVDVPYFLLNKIKSSGGEILYGNTLQELLGALYGNMYDGDPLGRWEPFKGLNSFEYEDSMRFFGRKKEVERICDDLEHNEGLLIVSGSTGTGKSSIIKAGLIPRLTQSNKGLIWSTYKPSELTESIFKTIYDEILSNLPSTKNEIDTFPEHALPELQKKLENNEQCFLFHIDQFEDFFTHNIDSSYLADLNRIQELTNIVSNVKIVLSIRNEYLAKLLDSGLIKSPIISNVSGQLTVDAWREIIIDQAEFSGITFENTDLAQQIIEDAVITSNALPMVEFVLSRLYDMAQVNEITSTELKLSDYEKIGGIRGAIAKRAEQAVEEVSANETVTHHFFSLFVGLTNEGIPYGKQVYVEMSINDNDAVGRLVTSLVSNNILTSAGASNERIIKLAHDSLFTNWTRLQLWLNRQSAFLEWKNTIDRNYNKWMKSNCNKDSFLIKDNMLLAEGNRYLEKNVIYENSLKDYLSRSNKSKHIKHFKQLFLFLILPVFLISVVWLDSKQVRYEYYTQIGYKWGVPFGIKKLRDEQFDKKQFRYRLVYEGGVISKYLGIKGKLVEHRFENNSGNLFGDFLFSDGEIAKGLYTYKKNGRVDTVSHYNKSSDFIHKLQYLFSENNAVVSMLDENNNSYNYKGTSAHKNKVFYKVSVITRRKIFFDPNGFKIKEIYHKDGYGNQVTDTFSSNGKKYNYNYNGNLIAETDLMLNEEKLENLSMNTKFIYDSEGELISKYFLKNGKPAKTINKNHRINYDYDEFGNQKKRTYFDINNQIISYQIYERNSHGQEVRISNFNSDGELMLNDEGYAVNESEYNSNGYINKISYIINDGISFRATNYSSESYTFDNNNRVLTVDYFDSLNKPIQPKLKFYTGFKYTYNDQGKVLSVVYFIRDRLDLNNVKSIMTTEYFYDNDGKLIRDTSFDHTGSKVPDSYSGCITSTIIYTSNGSVSSTSCLDAEDELILNNQGIAVTKYFYDINGFVVKVSYLGTQGELTVNKLMGYATSIQEYDSDGKVTKFIYLGLDEKPMLHLEYGIAGIISEYDSDGNAIKNIYLGLDEKPMLHPEYGIAGFIKEYDSNGYVTMRIDLGLDEKPMFNPEYGTAGSIREYDSNGNETKFIYLGLDEKPMLHPEYGTAGFIKEYDSNGNVTKYINLGLDEKPMLHPEYGTAGSISEYDTDGNVTKYINLGLDEKPMFHPENGTAGSIRKYDFQGNLIKWIDIDVNEKPMIHPHVLTSGYTRLYDSNGHVTKNIYLGLDEKPMFHPEYGTAGFIKEYDSNGNVTKQIYLGLDEKPMLSPKFGTAGRISEYNTVGNVTKWIWLGLDEKPMLQPELGIAGSIKEYDSNGNVTKEIYLGLDEKPMLHPEYGTAGFIKEYDSNGNAIKHIDIYMDKR